MKMKTTSNSPAMIQIDGSHGEGGGQILRTALSLSAITGIPFSLDSIRAGRKSPGLMRQHLACVRAVSQVCSAHVKGAILRSTCLDFYPGPIGHSHGVFEIGSAGSTGLLLQTLLPVLLHGDAESEITLRGGTHAIQAPCFDYLDEIYAPRLRAMGAQFTLELNRIGFFPAGGGEVEARITPSTLKPEVFDSESKPKLESVEILTTPSISDRVPEKEIDALARKLTFSAHQTRVRVVTDSQCPGNAILLRATGGTLIASHGQRGKTSERVAKAAAGAMNRYLQAGAPIDPFLADQLLVPMALAGGGEFVTAGLSSHFHTNVETIQQFLPIEVETLTNPNGGQRVLLTHH